MGNTKKTRRLASTNPNAKAIDHGFWAHGMLNRNFGKAPSAEHTAVTSLRRIADGEPAEMPFTQAKSVLAKAIKFEAGSTKYNQHGSLAKLVDAAAKAIGAPTTAVKAERKAEAATRKAAAKAKRNAKAEADALLAKAAEEAANAALPNTAVEPATGMDKLLALANDPEKLAKLEAIIALLG